MPLPCLALSGRPCNCHLSCSQAEHPCFLCRTHDDVDANRRPPVYFMRTFVLSGPLPISSERDSSNIKPLSPTRRSEEHTSELQSLTNLVCRLLLEKKKKNK